MAVSQPQTITFAIRGPIEHSDLPGLCDRVCALLREHRPALALCDVCGIGADGATVDALARLQLAARRTGCQVRLRGASPELLRLLDFLGLADVLPE
jgi:ABC-type transporter Mla MlaB component